MSKSSWEIKKKNGSKYDSEYFLKIRPGCKIKVRLIGDPVKVTRIFSNDRKCVILNNENVGNRLQSRYPSKTGNVSVRFACWCIDRADDSMKILEMPASVARALGNREALLGKKIADIAEGCDWSITTNGKKGMNVRYEAVYLNESPLTHSEIQMVEDLKSGEEGQFDLTKIFESLNYKEAEEKLFGI